MDAEGPTTLVTYNKYVTLAIPLFLLVIMQREGVTCIMNQVFNGNLKLGSTRPCRKSLII